MLGQLELAFTPTVVDLPRPRPSVRRSPVPLSPARIAPREELIFKADSLARKISSKLDVPVRLSITDNRATMISYLRQNDRLSLRLHHLFLDAPDDVISAVIEYVNRRGAAAGVVIDRYVREKQERIRRVMGKAGLKTQGQFFDLQSIFTSLNELYFQGSVEARIGWGRGSKKSYRRSIRLGTYSHTSREIRLHPALDHVDVPLYFIEYVVYHEMLHQIFPSMPQTRRHSHHPKAFRDREQAFEKYQQAMQWEKLHLERLLRR